MAETLAYMLAQAYELAGTHSVGLADAGGSHTETLADLGWYRTYLAERSAGDGTEAHPYELLDAVQTLLGSASWSVSLTTAGLVRITYLDSGTGTITWGANGTTLRNLLGFSGSTVGPLNENESATGTYLPTHCIFAISAEPDTGWVQSGSRFAGARMSDGRVYGWSARDPSLMRSLTLRLLPKDSATRTTYSMGGTPCYGPTSRWTSPGTSEPAQAPPWGALETLATAGGVSCGAALGTFQELLAGEVAVFDHCYLMPETVEAGEQNALSVDGYDARRDVGLQLSWYREDTR